MNISNIKIYKFVFIITFILQRYSNLCSYISLNSDNLPSDLKAVLYYTSHLMTPYDARDNFCQFDNCHLMPCQVNTFLNELRVSNLNDVRFIATKEFCVNIVNKLHLSYTYDCDRTSVRCANKAFHLLIFLLINTELYDLLCSNPTQYLNISFITLGMSSMREHTMSYLLKLPIFTPNTWSKRPSIMSTYSVIYFMIPNNDPKNISKINTNLFHICLDIFKNLRLYESHTPLVTCWLYSISSIIFRLCLYQFFDAMHCSNKFKRSLTTFSFFGYHETPTYYFSIICQIKYPQNKYVFKYGLKFLIFFWTFGLLFI